MIIGPVQDVQLVQVATIRDRLARLTRVAQPFLPEMGVLFSLDGPSNFHDQRLLHRSVRLGLACGDSIPHLARH